MNNLIDFDNRVCVVPAGSLPIDLAQMVTGPFYPVDVVTSPVGGMGGYTHLPPCCFDPPPAQPARDQRRNASIVLRDGHHHDLREEDA